jgi:uncharacterized protein (DUF488 family)
VAGGATSVEISTIGFTQHVARDFFGKIRDARIDRLIDVRVNNVSQLAGFAKRTDLEWFLRELCDVGYQHEPQLAPTKELLSLYQAKAIRWSEYEDRFLDLMATRRVEARYGPESFGVRPVLLCSEHTAEKCHRRLVAEYFKQHWHQEIVVKHL